MASFLTLPCTEAITGRRLAAEATVTRTVRSRASGGGGRAAWPSATGQWTLGPSVPEASDATSHAALPGSRGATRRCWRARGLRVATRGIATVAPAAPRDNLGPTRDDTGSARDGAGWLRCR